MSHTSASGTEPRGTRPAIAYVRIGVCLVCNATLALTGELVANTAAAARTAAPPSVSITTAPASSR